MVVKCAICRSYASDGSIKMFRIPWLHKRAFGHKLNLLKLRQALWVKACNLQYPVLHKRVCARHFVSGKPAALEDMEDIDWAPTLHLPERQQTETSETNTAAAGTSRGAKNSDNGPVGADAKRLHSAPKGNTEIHESEPGYKFNMSCCIEHCPDYSQMIVRFPRDALLQKRWQDAIKVGTGVTVNPFTADGSGQLQQICMSHFANPEDLEYQEPTRFVNGNLASCRLCHRFGHDAHMFSLDGELCDQRLDTVIQQTINIQLKREEFSQKICRECLIKVDVVRMIQSQYMVREHHFKNLRNSKAPLELALSAMCDEKIIIEEIEFEEIVDWEPVGTEPILEHGKDDTLLRTSSPNPTASVTPREILERECVTKERKLRKFNMKVPKPYMKKLVHLRSISSKKCYICSVMFKDQDELITHLTQEHASQIEYACKECDGKKFPMITAYNTHLSLHDASERPLKCNFCAVRYCTRQGLHVHENKEHGTDHKLPNRNIGNRSRPQCEICGKTFPSLIAIEQHKTIQHENGVVAQCKICQKTFASHGNLKRHLVVHSSEKPYACDICGIRYRVSTDLTKHVQIEHEGKPGVYQCTKCNISFGSKNEYSRHRNQAHWKPIPHYKCRLCTEVPTSLQELKDHIAADHPDEEYPHKSCSACSLKFLTGLQLNFHRYSKHNDGNSEAGKFMCEVCGKQHKSRIGLQWHMGRQHDTDKRFECETCGKQFILRQNLDRHKDIHQEVKRFACDFCTRTFSQRGAMLNHRRNIHTGEKPFQCQSCGARFKETSTYYRHRVVCQTNNEEVE